MFGERVAIAAEHAVHRSALCGKCKKHPLAQRFAFAGLLGIVQRCLDRALRSASGSLGVNERRRIERAKISGMPPNCARDPSERACCGDLDHNIGHGVAARRWIDQQPSSAEDTSRAGGDVADEAGNILEVAVRFT